MNKDSGNQHKNLQYFDLTPKDDISKNNPAFEALDWVIKADGFDEERKKRVTNIAISGPYGCGKSSIIDSYLRTYPEIKEQSIKISLVKFGINEKSDEMYKISSHEFEENFLRQLYYKKGSKQIYLNRAEKSKSIENKPKSIWILSAFAILFLLSNILYYNNTRQIFFDIFNTSTYKEITGTFLLGTMILLAFIGGMYILYKLLPKFVSLIKYGHVKVNGNLSLEISDNKTTIFNRELDDIFLIFKTNNYRYVFIEDLDRINNIEIFSHFRELNFLLNNSEEIDSRIVFIYAVRDDVFKTVEERTKFFDFIIPVVPVLGIANVDDTLWLKIKKLKLEKSLTREFVVDIASYIDGMRLMDNVLNEYIIYRKTIKGRNGRIKLYDKNLFSIILYKNLYPEKFIKNLNGNGEIEEIFKKKSELVTTIKKELENRSKINSESLNYNKSYKALLNPAIITFKELINIADKNQIEFVFTDNVLLSHLIRRGYIDENYYTYLSRFEGGIFSIEDRNFILGVNSNDRNKMDASLKGTEEIIKRLTDEDFEKESILNYDLLNALYDNPKKNEEKINKIIKQVQNERGRSINFIIGYLNVAIRRDLFIRSLANGWGNVFVAIESYNDISNEEKKNFLLLLINNLPAKRIISINIDNRIKSIITKNEYDILNSLDLSPEKLYMVIHTLGVYYDTIPKDIYRKATMEIITDTKKYKFSRANVDKIISTISDASINSINAKPKYITLINKMENISIKEKMQSELGSFVENILVGKKNFDTLSDVISLLEYCDYYPEYCSKIIESEEAISVAKLRFFIRRCRNMNRRTRETVVETMMKYGKVELTWDNIYEAWNIFNNPIWLEHIVEKKLLDENLSKEKIPVDDGHKEFNMYVDLIKIRLRIL